MPRGRPRKEAKEEAMVMVAVPVKTESVAVSVVADSPVVAPAAEKPEPPKLTGEALAIFESRKVLQTKIDPSQEYFESPEGFIVIGDKGRGRVWCRQANGGKGMWINPKR